MLMILKCVIYECNVCVDFARAVFVVGVRDARARLGFREVVVLCVC